MGKPRDAQSVMASLVSSGTTHGEPLFVQRRASIASELARKVSAIGCPGSKSPSTSCQTMTDEAIAGQLKALADEYQRRAEKASQVDAAKALARWLLALNVSSVHDLMGSC
jgi:hypothetical protein